MSDCHSHLHKSVKKFVLCIVNLRIWKDCKKAAQITAGDTENPRLFLLLLLVASDLANQHF